MGRRDHRSTGHAACPCARARRGAERADRRHDVRRLSHVAALALLVAGCGSAPDVRGGRWIAWTAFDHGRATTWIARPDGTGRRILARDAAEPEVSPDGRWVVYARARPVYRAFLMPARGGPTRELVRGVNRLAWATSRQLVGKRGGELVSVSLDGGVDLIDRGDIQSWGISPDGTRIVYERGAACHSDLYVRSLAGGPAVRITHDGHSNRPVWGPGWIAYSRDRDCAYDSELWVVRPDGQAAHRLAARRSVGGEYGLAPVAWHGRALLAGVITEWGFTALAVDPRTGAYRGVSGTWYASDLSHDGKHVLVFGGGAEGPYTIATVPYAGGHPHVIAHGDVGYESWNR